MQRSVTLARPLKISKKENLTCMTSQVLTHALQLPMVLLLNMRLHALNSLSGGMPQQALS